MKLHISKKSSLPIGIFDSGLGGLTVVHEIRQLLPNENIVYLGDTARVPYGTRSEEVIKKFSEEDVDFLLSKKVKCIVIACHTASSVAGQYLKQKYKNIKIFDVVTPTVKFSKSISGKTVVLATRATVNSKAFSNNIGSQDIACPLFVPFIEEGEVEGGILEELIKKYLKDLKFDNLILACTHYPIIKNTIKKIVGANVKFINPGELVAKELAIFLKDQKLLNYNENEAKLSINVTDLNDRFVNVARLFLQENLHKNIQKIQL